MKKLLTAIVSVIAILFAGCLSNKNSYQFKSHRCKSKKRKKSTKKKKSIRVLTNKKH